MKKGSISRRMPRMDQILSCPTPTFRPFGFPVLGLPFFVELPKGDRLSFLGPSGAGGFSISRARAFWASRASAWRRRGRLFFPQEAGRGDLLERLEQLPGGPRWSEKARLRRHMAGGGGWGTPQEGRSTWLPVLVPFKNNGQASSGSLDHFGGKSRKFGDLFWPVHSGSKECFSKLGGPIPGRVVSRWLPW